MNYSEIDYVVHHFAPLLAESEPMLARTIGWEVLYATLYPEIRSVLRTSRLSESDRDDCCQEIWVALSQKLPRLDRLTGPRSFCAWLQGMIRHKMIDRSRHTRQRNIERLPESESTLTSHASQETRTPVERVEQNEEVQRLLRQVACHFRPEHLKVFRLRYLEEQSVEETANRLNFTVEQVRQIAHRVLKSLQNTANQCF